MARSISDVIAISGRALLRRRATREPAAGGAGGTDNPSAKLVPERFSLGTELVPLLKLRLNDKTASLRSFR
jgi:hypothetical protein